MATRILIVDDHALVAEGLHALLEANDQLEVIGRVKSGREAVQHALAHEPDLVLMDVMMPESNGIEASRTITTRLPATKVIMLSMHPNPAYVYRAIEAGASGYLLKRSAARELFAAIERVQSGRRYLSPEITEALIDQYVVKGEGMPDPLAPDS